MKRRDAVLHGDIQFTIKLARAAKDQWLVGALLMQPGQLPARGRFETVYPRCKGFQHPRLRVGLGGIEQFAVIGQHGAHCLYMLFKGRQVVDIGTQWPFVLSLELFDTAGDSDRKSHAHLLFAINANGLGSWV